METAAHPRSLFKPRTFGKMFVTLSSSASLWSGVVKTFRCAATHRTMEIIFELLAQLVLEIVVQGIFELGGRGIVSIFRREGSTLSLIHISEPTDLSTSRMPSSA